MAPSQIIYEIKAGVPPDSPLINNEINQYWLPDESEILRLTHYGGDIPGDHWDPDGNNILRLNDAGISSKYWTLDGFNILRLNT